MIKVLRKSEEVILFNNVFHFTEEENKKVASFLTSEFELESSNYPKIKTVFNPQAALWSAQVVYIIAQMIVFRKNNIDEVEQIIPKENFDVTVDNMLSIDLCLRFLPQMISKLNELDQEDILIEKGNTILKKWHYSNVEKATDIPNNLDELYLVDGFKNMYINRIVQYQNIALATHQASNRTIKNALNIYEDVLWPAFSSQ